jgi:NADPH-dependent 7-cyano-7-deazaguanine reductase QueF
MHLFELMALLPIVFTLVATILFFLILNSFRNTAKEKNQILREILSELKSRKE